jgi:hypothetical protein
MILAKTMDMGLTLDSKLLLKKKAKLANDPAKKMMNHRGIGMEL